MLPGRAALLARLCDDAERLLGVSGDELLAAVLQREALGPTGLDSGLALPHAQIPGIERPVALLATLSRPIDFGGLDGLPADLVVLLISPENAGSDHLKALARIVRSLRLPGFVGALRAATGDAALYDVVGPHSPFQPARPVAYPVAYPVAHPVRREAVDGAIRVQ